MKHINITLTGRVQGVGFRNAAKRQAIVLGINGFVENNYDGSVYIEAEGNNLELDEFVNWCWEGPTFAQVDDVKIIEGPLKNLSSFETAY
jgi:acylphosphatase